MSNVIVSAERCKSCGICIRECPMKAIKVGLILNEKGFYAVEIDENKCVGCGVCCMMCPDSALEMEE